MEKETQRLIFRWSCITGGAIFAFWAGWYFAVGEVPTINSVEILGSQYRLPFGISSWVDAIVGPIWSIIIILILKNDGFKEGNLGIQLICFGLTFWVAAGLIIGLFIGRDNGLFVGVASGLTIGLGIGLAFGLIFFVLHETGCMFKSFVRFLAK